MKDLNEKIAEVISAVEKSSKIDMEHYTLQTHVDDNGKKYQVNVGPVSPMNARELQRLLQSRKESRRVRYTDPSGQSVLLLVSERSFQLLARLSDGKWHHSSTLKSILTETRKPLSDLRHCGVIIGTKRKGGYKLFGEIELYPLGPQLSIPRLGDILPDIGTAQLIEFHKNNRRHANRVERVNKIGERLERLSDQDYDD